MRKENENKAKNDRLLNTKKREINSTAQVSKLNRITSCLLFCNNKYMDTETVIIILAAIILV